ncbi:hypothetical protein J6590_047534 [Homalodisca vitripennis]|nr:hypothetical protein J6590_047534 [Homalodisca vitripennis]
MQKVLCGQWLSAGCESFLTLALLNSQNKYFSSQSLKFVKCVEVGFNVKVELFEALFENLIEYEFLLQPPTPDKYMLVLRVAIILSIPANPHIPGFKWRVSQECSIVSFAPHALDLLSPGTSCVPASPRAHSDPIPRAPLEKSSAEGFRIKNLTGHKGRVCFSRDDGWKIKDLRDSHFTEFSPLVGGAGTLGFVTTAEVVSGWLAGKLESRARLSRLTLPQLYRQRCRCHSPDMKPTSSLLC